MNCVFVEIEGEQPNERGWRRVVCVLCQRPTQPQPNPPELVVRVCKFATVAPIAQGYRPGLGDRLHNLLQWLGITRDLFRTEVGSYVVVGGMNCRLERVTEATPCECEWRQELLNRIGRRVAFCLVMALRWLLGRR